MTDIISTFMDRCRESGAEVHLVPTTAAVSDLVSALSTEPPVVWPPELADELAINEFSLDLAPSSPQISITRSDFAVADTGSLVSDLTDENLRIASTTPDIHVALISSHRIVPSLGDAIAQFQPIPPYLAVTTGPSRTGDIECTLTIGAHGPRRLVVVVIDKEGLHE